MRYGQLLELTQHSTVKGLSDTQTLLQWWLLQSEYAQQLLGAVVVVLFHQVNEHLVAGCCCGQLYWSCNHN